MSKTKSGKGYRVTQRAADAARKAGFTIQLCGHAGESQPWGDAPRHVAVHVPDEQRPRFETFLKARWNQ